MKKADGMPFWIIVMAVIALIVMIVLIGIFGKKTTEFTEELQSCQLKGGECSAAACGDNAQEMQDTNCKKEEHCCVVLGNG